MVARASETGVDGRMGSVRLPEARRDWPRNVNDGARLGSSAYGGEILIYLVRKEYKGK